MPSSTDPRESQRLGAEVVDNDTESASVHVLSDHFCP
jgi:hypothetical protein